MTSNHPYPTDVALAKLDDLASVIRSIQSRGSNPNGDAKERIDLDSAV